MVFHVENWNLANVCVCGKLHKFFFVAANIKANVVCVCVSENCIPSSQVTTFGQINCFICEDRGTQNMWMLIKIPAKPM